MVGVVTSANKTPKTLRVEVVFLVRHAKYGKYERFRSVLHVHDEKQEAHKGDRVQVMECRPVSKQKNWRLVKVLERAPQD
jgi:small subunit ribosomal protein S17